MRNKTMFERFLDAVGKTGNETLRWYYQKKMIKDQLLDKQTRAALIGEITEQVLSRLSFHVDITDAIQDIEKLSHTIVHIGRKGG